MNRLQDKVVILTGGGTGIGQSACIKFAEEGADVVLAYHHSRAGAEETVKAIEAAGRRGLAVQTDLTNVESARALIHTAYEKFGHIDVLVNNAVIRNLAFLRELNDDLWDNTMETNLRSVFLTSQAVAPIMISQGGGSIVNIASQHGARPADNRRAGYASSKGGMMALTRSMATELSPKGIFVNAIVLGSVPTSGSAATKATDSDANKLQSATDEYEMQFMPARRRGRLSESSELMVILANANQTYMTGECVAAEGGWTIID